MKINLKNKSYILSAGADGIGLKIDEKIVEAGGQVYLSDINKSKILQLKQIYQKKILATTL